MMIIHVYHHYYPVVGGLERAVQKVAEEQAKLGHEVHVLTSMCKGVPRDEIINNVYIHRIKTKRLLYPDLTIPREDPKEILKRADIVHIHSQNSLFNIIIAEKAKKLGLKVATYFMVIDSFRSHPKFFKRLVGNWYQRTLTIRTLDISDLVFVKSLRDKYILQKEYHVDPIYVPDGISEYYFSLPRNPKLFRREFSIYEDTVILYVGRLHPAKGPHILINAVPYLTGQVNNFKVVLLGPGRRNWLKRLVKKLGIQRYILIAGRVPERIKISAIDSSKIVVIPSLYDYVEAFSLVVSEAWARGKPVVASSIGELQFRIKHGKNGILVPPGKPKLLAKAILDALDLNLKIHADLITWKQVARKLCSFYLYK